MTRKLTHAKIAMEEARWKAREKATGKLPPHLSGSEEGVFWKMGPFKTDHLLETRRIWRF